MKEKKDQKAIAGIAWPILVSRAKAKKSITYGELATSIGLHLRSWRFFLSEIQDYCRENKLPTLQSIVVSKKTQYPGHGYRASPTNGIIDIHQKIFEYNWDSQINPFL